MWFCFSLGLFDPQADSEQHTISFSQKHKDKSMIYSLIDLLFMGTGFIQSFIPTATAVIKGVLLAYLKHLTHVTGGFL